MSMIYIVSRRDKLERNLTDLVMTFTFHFRPMWTHHMNEMFKIESYNVYIQQQSAHALQYFPLNPTFKGVSSESTSRWRKTIFLSIFIWEWKLYWVKAHSHLASTSAFSFLKIIQAMATKRKCKEWVLYPFSVSMSTSP